VCVCVRVRACVCVCVCVRVCVCVCVLYAKLASCLALVAAFDRKVAGKKTFRHRDIIVV
jgi:hypothetical protein